MDTLDYSGSGFNEGSKVVIAAAGAPRRGLSTELPSGLNQLPAGFSKPQMALPGVMAVQGPQFTHHHSAAMEIERLTDFFKEAELPDSIPLVVLVDDSTFTSAKLNNFLWTVFTRSNPSHDIYGVDSSIEFKHWGCQGALVIDGRIKPHHAPPLIEDPAVSKRVDALAAPGGPLHGIF
jgi:4-hydroxy-3-polyprenylbenzoate decarboxylase